VGASTSSDPDEGSETELPYSLSEWDAWFHDTDPSESEASED